MTHVTIVGLALALAGGLVSIALISRVPSERAPRTLTHLGTALLLYNLWLIAWLLLEYLREYALQALGPGWARSTTLTLVWVMTLCGTAWARSHTHATEALVAGAYGPRIREGLAAWPVTRVVDRGAAVILVGVTITWVLAVSGLGVRPFAYSVRATSLVVMSSAAAVTAWSLASARLLGAGPWRQAVTRLAFAYLAFFGGLLALRLAWQPLTAMSTPLPHVLDLALETFYSAASVAWALTLPAPEAAPEATRQPEIPAVDISRLDQVADRIGLTRREREVVALICQGKTNQQIGDELFISLTTVKDHNYAIFQKAGVRNRTALARLFLQGS